ncbi:DUF6174 domain-containing protein [Ulvibacterium marinum]|uniref:DUF6174 domain-containing protein n=1 Tax=Ulvibacterium marinum TaxID=2419782 RepID=UPI002494E818|nr:DUF6174 domain-containing protein [Ulvibacterium marinum]
MFIRSLISILTVFLILSCDSDDASVQNALELNRQKWQRQDIKNYSIQEKHLCFCAGLEWQIFVQDGVKDTVIVSAPYVDYQPYADTFEKARSIEEAFEFIQNFDTNNVDSFEVTYNSKYGYPTEISIDSKKGVADDEITFAYSNFSPN